MIFDKPVDIWKNSANVNGPVAKKAKTPDGGADAGKATAPD